jgi:hypothetical protein
MELPKADPSSGSRTPSPRKGRSRSLSIRGSNPLDTPLTKSDFDLATLRKQILNEQEKEKETVKDATTPEPTPSPVRRRARSVSFVATNPIDTPITTTEFQLAAYRKQLKREQEQEEHVKETLTPRSTKPTRPPLPTILESPSRTPTRCTQTVNTTHQWHITTDKKGADKIKSDALKLLSDKRDELKANMNYQNYIDSPGGPGANSRQAPPSPSQGMNHPNGMNGGMGMGGMVGYPTPAGHQSDLNYIMSMVEDLSLVLRQNQLLTASVVEKVGKVREKASTMNMTNDELVAAVASELNGKT